MILPPYPVFLTTLRTWVHFASLFCLVDYFIFIAEKSGLSCRTGHNSPFVSFDSSFFSFKKSIFIGPFRHENTDEEDKIITLNTALEALISVSFWPVIMGGKN
jgi:hypothetical protein